MRSCYTYRQDTLAYAVSFVSRNVPNSVQFAKPGGMPPVSGLTHSQGYFLPYPLFEQLAAEYSVLALYRYETLDTLLAALVDHVIAPAEQRANEIVSKK